MKIYTKLICIMLAVMMVMTVVASCAQKETEGENTTENKASESIHPVYEQTDLDVKTFEDELFTVIYPTIGTWVPTPIAVNAKDANEDTVSKASYDRDRKFEELTEMTISYTRSESNPNGTSEQDKSYTIALRNLVASGDIGDYDVVMLGAQTVGALLTESFFTNLNEYDNYIHTERDYYNSKFNQEMSLADKQFFAMGYYTTGNIRGTEAVLVNNTILTQLHESGDTIEELYQLALNKQWTYEAMMSYDKGFATGNVDTENPLNNKYTLIMSQNASQGLYYELGGTLVEKDDQDMPVVSIENAVNVDLLSYLKENVTKNGKVTIVPNDGHSQVFQNSQGLFMLAIVASLGASRDAVGIDERLLPAPLYEEGDNYHSYLAAWNLNVATIPAAVGDADKAAYGFELYMALSYNYIYPQFYEQKCQLQYVENSTEAQIYDLIVENTYVDFSYLYGFLGNSKSGEFGIRPIFMSSTQEVGSLVESVSGKLATGIETFLKTYDIS